MPLFNIRDVLRIEVSNYAVKVEEHNANHPTILSQHPKSTKCSPQRMKPKSSNAGCA